MYYNLSLISFQIKLKLKINFKKKLISAIQQEKEKIQLISGIENFNPAQLKPTETNEKNPLPTKEVIEEEKKA